MAKTGMDRLREASQQSKQDNCEICVAADMDHLCDAKCNDVRGIALRSIYKQIEDEHAAELKEARDARDIALRDALRERELTEEAREVVARLRAIDPYNANAKAYNALFDEPVPFGMPYGEANKLSVDRICELIEHGSKKDVDVAALRRLASRMEHSADNPIYKGDGGEVEDYYTALLAADARTISKAVEDAPKQKPTTDETCIPLEEQEHIDRRNAAVDWVEDNGGLDAVRERMRLYTDMLNRIDSSVSGDEQTCFDSTTPMDEATDLFDAIFAELDKRLMPPGMEWPRFEDGEKVEFGEMFLRFDGKHENDGEGIVDIAIHGGDPLTYRLNGDYQGCQLVKRPEPEVLGADGLPIKVGETVYTRRGSKRIVAEAYPGECPDSSDAPWVRFESGGWDRAAIIVHLPSVTQGRIDAEAVMKVSDYFGCRGCEQGECPVKVDGETPAERYGVESCQDAMTLDLLRRQRELDAKTMGCDAS